MSLTLIIYLIEVLSKVVAALEVVCLASIFIAICGVPAYIVNKGEQKEGNAKVAAKVIKISLSILMLSGLVSVLIPSQKTAYMMLGTYTASEVAKNPKVQDTSDKILKIIDKKLDQYVEEVEQEIVKKVKR